MVVFWEQVIFAVADVPKVAVAGIGFIFLLLCPFLPHNKKRNQCTLKWSAREKTSYYRWQAHGQIEINKFSENGRFFFQTV